LSVINRTHPVVRIVKERVPWLDCRFENRPRSEGPFRVTVDNRVWDLDPLAPPIPPVWAAWGVWRLCNVSFV